MRFFKHILKVDLFDKICLLESEFFDSLIADKRRVDDQSNPRNPVKSLIQIPKHSDAIQEITCCFFATLMDHDDEKDNLKQTKCMT